MENFKSYAGVQEIGPFHKVGHRIATLDDDSVMILACALKYLCLSRLAVLLLDRGT